VLGYGVTFEEGSVMAHGGSHSSNGSKRLRAFVTVLGIVLPFGPALVGGCGSSSAPAPMATPPAPTLTGDATVPLVMVITGGGGGGSSGAMIVNPFGDTSSSSSSGSSSGTVSPPDSGSDDASNGGSLDGPVDEPNPLCDGYVPAMCGVTPCDLRSNTCCVDLSLNTRCAPGHSSACHSNEVTIQCLQACECAGGQVCCGVEDTIQGVVQSKCQTVADGDLCKPHPQTTTQASAQLCKVTSECKNGQDCITQTCIYNATLSVCGLQSQDPFNCHP
jgi:hypothetical protein